MISLLAAYTKNNRVIGNKGKIPWNLPSERNRFKKICKNKYVLMGRKSFEEIGHALPYCTLVIISKTLKKAPEKCMLVHSLEEGIELCSRLNQTEILIAGGEQIYRQSLPLAKKIYATEIKTDFDGDAFFPPLDKNWKCVKKESKCENNIEYEYLTFLNQV